jgi:acetyltransferase-like isoleucine patch superfamily enzyme
MIYKILRFFKRSVFLLRKRGVVYGKNVIIDMEVKIYNNSNPLLIGDNVYLRGIKRGYQAGMPYPTTILIDIPKAYIKIGSNTRINGAYIHAQKSIDIGDNCVIASGVNIIDSNGHNLYSVNRTIGRDIPGDIVIGKNVWIGLNAIILKNTYIGDNCVISAGSVVKGTFSNNSLIVGNPAIKVKTLNINETSHSK